MRYATGLLLALSTSALERPRRAVTATKPHGAATSPHGAATSPRGAATSPRGGGAGSADLVAHATGVAIGVGSCVVYAPIIASVIKERSADGLSPATFSMILASCTCSAPRRRAIVLRACSEVSQCRRRRDAERRLR